MEGQNIKIITTDTGIGIKEEDKAKLFKAFSKIELGQKIHLNQTGVGLGLSIANALVKILGPNSHQGIKVESEYGKGSVFTFLLKERFEPNSEIQFRKPKLSKGYSSQDRIQDGECSESSIPNHSQVQIVPETRVVELIRSNSRITEINHEDEHFNFNEISPIKNSRDDVCKCPPILIVDDDCFNVLALETMLRLLGYTCNASYNGEDAIEKIMDRQNKPCCVNCEQYKLLFMDYSMPIKDGLTTTREIRDHPSIAECNDIKIIGCTALVSERRFQECMAAGMDEVISKPLIRSKLEELLRKALPLPH
jgi:CheY-like chemotaxis protein